MNHLDNDVIAGQAVYTSRTLLFYDFFVLGVSNHFLWQCPTSLVEKHYASHVSENHLEVGVGTGYYPNRCQFKTGHPRIALMDLNQHTLNYASKRIARYQPETYVQNILEPIAHQIQTFDSIAMNYLLHCVPGSIPEKAIAFDHLKTLMSPGCRVFGSTILQEGVERNWAACQLMNLYNKKGIFSNEKDSVQNLQAALNERFTDVEVSVVGCVALFSAKYE